MPVDRFDDPVALFDAAVSAVGGEDWERVASLCDPISLRLFRRETLDQLSPDTPRPSMTVERIMASSPPGMTRERAEAMLQRFKEMSDPASRMAAEFPGIGSIDALRALAAEELFARWLAAKWPLQRLRDRLPASGGSEGGGAAVRKSRPKVALHFRALGVVADGDEYAHIVFRNEFDLDPAAMGVSDERLATYAADEVAVARQLMTRQNPSVSTCRRQPDGSWRLIADRSFLRVSNSVAVAYATQLRGSPGEA